MQTQRLAAALAVSLPLLLVTAWLVRRRLKKAEPTPEPAAAEDAASPDASCKASSSSGSRGSSKITSSSNDSSMNKGHPGSVSKPSSSGASAVSGSHGSSKSSTSSGETKDELGSMRKREQQERKDQRRASAASHQILRRDASHSRVQKVREIRSALERAGDMQIVDDAEKFELVEVLGIGTFGQAELRRVADSDGASDGSFIVIKRVPLQKLSDWAIGALVGEVTNGAAMRHPHIVQLFGAYLSRRNELCLALQYAAGGTLDDTIKFQEQRGPFPVDFITTWLSQLCSAVQYMHDQRVLHRDISSGNVFLSFGGDILLGDLGLSRQLGAGDAVGATKVKTQVGTPPYMSLSS